MIIFDLTCRHDHRFEGWFSNTEDFQKQQTSGLLTCPVCGSEQVTRIPSASHLNLGKSSEAGLPQNLAPIETAQSYGELVQRLHDYVVRNFDDVGRDFAEQARRMHYGEADNRRIRGSTSYGELLELHEEGIEAILLPRTPDKDKMN
jgi:hypothetical protein